MRESAACMKVLRWYCTCRSRRVLQVVQPGCEPFQAKKMRWGVSWGLCGLQPHSHLLGHSAA